MHGTQEEVRSPRRSPDSADEPGDWSLQCDEDSLPDFTQITPCVHARVDGTAGEGRQTVECSPSWGAPRCQLPSSGAANNQ